MTKWIQQFRRWWKPPVVVSFQGGPMDGKTREFPNDFTAFGAITFTDGDEIYSYDVIRLGEPVYRYEDWNDPNWKYEFPLEPRP